MNILLDKHTVESIKRLPDAFYNNMCEMSLRDIAYIVLNAVLGTSIKSDDLRSIADSWIIDEGDIQYAGEAIYAYEPLKGVTMSEFDSSGRLAALLVNHMMYVSQIDSNTVVVSYSSGDSIIAYSKAFMSVNESTPIFFQSAGSLTDVEKQQLSYVVPKDNLWVVKCDEDALDRVVNKAFDFMDTRDRAQYVVLDPLGIAHIISRTVMLFDAYRRMRITGETRKVVVAIDGSEKGRVVKTVLTMLGLPVRFVLAEKQYSESELIQRAYKKTGYILTPRSVMAWSALDTKLVNTNDEVGVFVQTCHPGKYRSYLEPLLNRVIMLPHKLYFNVDYHTKYRYVMPTVQSIIHCLHK